MHANNHTQLEKPKKKGFATPTPAAASCLYCDRHCMAAMRNSNYYELGLIHPKVHPFHAPVYLNYEDHLDSIDEIVKPKKLNL